MVTTVVFHALVYLYEFRLMNKTVFNKLSDKEHERTLTLHNT